MPTYNEQDQKGLIITDDIAIDPILDFNLYRDAIVNIIRNSYPKFTIGIFGDWGTGKSTIMDSINRKLQGEDKDLVIVRFEAWRYEREEQFALIPLLKTIAFALPEEQQFQNLKRKLKRGAINLLKKTPDIVSSIISKYINEDVGMITKEAFDSFKKEFNSKMELLAEVDRDTLYFDGFDDIKNEINKIRNKNSNFKIVVFIDDLDRCSPKKTLEVLESIKVFLGMEGFIYIIGLSQDIVTKLIDIEYKESGIKGEQYIKKIIQIPITLPKWDNQDIVNLVKDFVKKEIIDDKYKKTIDENIELISTAIENNPREIKRFLNNFIVAFEIFSPSKHKVVEKELLVIQAIQIRWNKFYDLLIKSDENFHKELNRYLQMDEEILLKNLESDEIKKDDGESYDLKVIRILRDFKTDTYLWSFLRKNSTTLNNIKDWNIYRRATEVGIEPTIQKIKDVHNEAYKLLLDGKITIFNETRKRDEFQVLNLSKVDLSWINLAGAILSKADLSKADLSGAILSKADLSKADLSGAILSKADLSGAILSKADLSGAILSKTDLSGALLHGANLSGADLSWAILSKTDLSGADLSKTYLSEADLTDAILSKTDLSKADLSHTYMWGANLSEADLSGALLSDLSGADLSKANLSEADLSWAHLSGADLSKANLSEADLSGADLSGADLSGADLSNSTIINQIKYDSLRIDKNTNFNNGIIDNWAFIDYISKFTKNVPEKIKDKKELKIKLKEKRMPEEVIEELLKISKLSD